MTSGPYHLTGQVSISFWPLKCPSSLNQNPTGGRGCQAFHSPPHPQPQTDTPQLLTCEHAPDDGAHARQEVCEGPGRRAGEVSRHPAPCRPRPLRSPALTCASLSASPSWARARRARRPREAPDRPSARWRPSHVWSQRTDSSSAPGTGGEAGPGPGLRAGPQPRGPSPRSCPWCGSASTVWRRKQGPRAGIKHCRARGPPPRPLAA